MKLLILISVLLSIPILFIVYQLTLGCYSPETYIKRTVSNPVYSEDGSSIAFVLLKTQIRKPQGLCKFPDGGSVKVVENVVSIYIVEEKDKSVKKVAEKTVPKEMRLSDSNLSTVEVVSWQDNTIFFYLFREEAGKSTRAYYMSNIHEKTIQNDTQRDPESRTISPNDPTIWVSYEFEQGIVSYKGGDIVAFTYEDGNTIFHPELAKQELLYTWISFNDIQNL